MSEATTGAPLGPPTASVERWYCPQGCQAFEPRLPVHEPPECGRCGAPMSTDPAAFDRVHEAIEDAGIAAAERARSGS